jgi:hypothetical protein
LDREVFLVAMLCAASWWGQCMHCPYYFTLGT